MTNLSTENGLPFNKRYASENTSSILGSSKKLFNILSEDLIL
jgi:hypothetical protein